MRAKDEGPVLAIGIFARAPVPGATKTRLARSIGDEAAASLHEAFLRDTLELAARATGRTGSGAGRVTLFTAGAHPLFDALAREDAARGQEANSRTPLSLAPQSGGDLGARMAAAIESMLAEPLVSRAIVLGSDAPSIPLRVLKAAAVSQASLALGPSDDGGYYLVAASKVPSFVGVPWSSPETLARTLERNPGAALLEPWFDVDELRDLELLEAQLRLRPSMAPNAARELIRLGRLEPARRCNYLAEWSDEAGLESPAAGTSRS